MSFIVKRVPSGVLSPCVTSTSICELTRPSVTGEHVAVSTSLEPSMVYVTFGSDVVCP